MLSYSIGYSTTKGHDSGCCVMAFELVGVAGFEPAASSSRTSGASGRLAVIPANSVCWRLWWLAIVRGRCCTCLLYSTCLICSRARARCALANFRFPGRAYPQVAANRASVLRWRPPPLLSIGRCCCGHRCYQLTRSSGHE